MRVFLDDFRDPEDCLNYMSARIGNLNPIYSREWVVVRNFNDFVRVVSANIDAITHVSFDHDLAPEHYEHENQGGPYLEKTGYDAAKWMKEFYALNNTDLPRIFVHSMNPIGCENIKSVFNERTN